VGAKIIDGKKIAAEIREELAREVMELKAKGIIPGLAVILVGDDPASKVYVTNKNRAAETLGYYSVSLHLPADTSQDDLLSHIEKFNRDEKIHGILVQLPLPEHIDPNRIIEAIHWEKDVDGFHPVNVGKLVLGQECFWPCTPAGILELLGRSGISVAGKHVVIVGRSNIVGKPLANLLMQKAPWADATVTVCHSRTKSLSNITQQADILIAAIGRARFITAEMVREGAVVVDVGVNRVEDPSRKSGYRLVGDVDFEAVKEKAAAITPVPGGVGPMTITMLMKNTLMAAKNYLKRARRAEN
jgi:methylenetetrahydrofolate dehydrogenase (NADP+)/methenyltetrahydrofolate cyclohydrolase